MIVTIFCDASWCPETQVGGWAAWVKSSRIERGVIYGGHFRVSVPSSTEAELMAAVNALHSALNAVSPRIVDAYDVILFESDCHHALNLLCGWKPKTVLERKALEHLSKMQTADGLTFRGRHVRGHSRGSTREALNNRVDREARVHMQGLREHVRRGGVIAEYSGLALCSKSPQYVGTPGRGLTK